MQGTIVNDDVRALLEGGNLVLQNLHTRLVWPVVKDGSEEVDGCTFDWLLVKDGVWHELKAILDLGWNFGWSFVDDTRQILDHEVEVWKAFGESDRDRTIRLSQQQSDLVYWKTTCPQAPPTSTTVALPKEAQSKALNNGSSGIMEANVFIALANRLPRSGLASISS